MSSATRRKLDPSLPLHLELDLIPHGRSVRVCDARGTVLGTLDRPLAEWLVDQANAVLGRAA